MTEYIVATAEHGFVIKSPLSEGAKVYAFSTLKELTDYLPKLIEPQIPLDLTEPGVEK